MFIFIWLVLILFLTSVLKFLWSISLTSKGKLFQILHPVSYGECLTCSFLGIINLIFCPSLCLVCRSCSIKGCFPLHMFFSIIIKSCRTHLCPKDPEFANNIAALCFEVFEGLICLLMYIHLKIYYHNQSNLISYSLQH